MLEKGSSVAVIGAGIVGLATACQLAEAGMTVTLIDRGEPATLGPSGGNAGMLAATGIFPLGTPGIWKDALSMWLDTKGPLHIPLRNLPEVAPWLIKFLRASTKENYRAGVAALAALNEHANVESEALYTRAGLHNAIRKTGTFNLYETEQQFRAETTKWEDRTRYGIPWQALSLDELAEREPDMNTGAFAHAVYMPGFWHVSDPYHVAQGLAGYAQRLGVAFRQNTVAAVRPEGIRTFIQLQDGNSVHADATVIAGGIWSRALAKTLGDRLPLVAERGYNATLTDPGVTVNHSMSFSHHGFVLTPLETGLRIGGQVELGGTERPPNHARTATMLGIVKRFFPGLQTEQGPRWMGARPSTPDSLPAIGPSKASPRILYACGHGHYGLTQSAITGKLIAGYLAEGSALPEPFLPARFG
ncbi:MAG: FAD-dependent oxidoreductase [Pseudomonadota bacterium]